MEQRPKTRTELQELRKQQLRKIGAEFMDKHIKSHPHIIEITKPVLVQPPPYTAPYVENPKIRTKAELEEHRKSQGLCENAKTVNFECKNLSERVEEREKLRTLIRSVNSYRAQLDSKKAENLQQFQEKFAKRPKGIHGEELPKFTDHLQDYWRLKQGYTEHPSTAPKEENLSRPISVFTRLRSKMGSVDSEVTKKPGEVNPFPNFTPKEFEGFALRPSSRFMEEFIFSSRPASQSSNAPIIKSVRPSTAMVKKEEKSRPFTAGTAKSSDKSVVRSKANNPHSSGKSLKGAKDALYVWDL